MSEREEDKGRSVFGECVEKCLSCICTLSSAMDDAKQSLMELKIAAGDAKSAAPYENDDSANKIIRLNIGGTLFMTEEHTLLKSPTHSKRPNETFFSAMLSSGNWQPDKRGEYFIDRSPTSFAFILDYLRTGEMVDLKTLPDYQRTLLRRDLDFYQIDSSCRCSLKWNTSDITAQRVKVTEEGTRVDITTERQSGHMAYIRATALEECMGTTTNVIKWRVTITDGKTGICAVSHEKLQEDVAISVGGYSGKIFNCGSAESFVTWSGDPRVIDFEWDRIKRALTITAMNKTVQVLCPNSIENPCPFVSCCNGTGKIEQPSS